MAKATIVQIERRNCHPMYKRGTVESEGCRKSETLSVVSGYAHELESVVLRSPALARPLHLPVESVAIPALH